MARLKIPRFSDKIREVAASSQGAQGFSGGQIQAASDTGLESLGRGMSNLARNLGKIEEDRQSKEGTLWSQDNLTTMKAQMANWSNEYEISDESETGSGRPEAALRKMQEISDMALEKAPSKIASDIFKKEVNRYKNEVFLKSTDYVAKKTLSHQLEQLNDSAKNIAYVAFDDVTTLLENIDGIVNTIDNLEDLPQTREIEGYRNIWSKEKREEKKDKVVKNIISSTVKAINDESDSNKLLTIKAILESGQLDKYLTVEDKQAKLSQINNKLGSVNYGMQVKFADTLENNILSIGETGEEVTPFTEKDFINVYGKKQGNKNWIDYSRQVEDSKKLYSDEFTLALGTQDEKLALINKRTKEAEGDFRKTKHLEKLQKLREAIVTMLEKDPKGFAKRYRPDITMKLESEDTATFQRGIDDLISLQVERNINRQDVDVIGEVEALTAADQLMFSSTKSSDVQALMLTYKERYGNHFHTFIKDIQEKGDLDERFVALLDYVDTPAFAHNLSLLKSATVKGGQILDSNAVNPSMRGKNQKLSTNSTWKSYVASFGGDPAATEHLDGLEDLIVTLAQHSGSMQQKNKDVKKYVKEFIGDYYLITPEFVIPRKEVHGQDEDDYEDKAEYLIEKIMEPANNLNIDPLGKGVTTLTDKELRAIQTKDLDDNVMWRQTASGDGIELVWAIEGLGRLPVTINDGMPYAFKWKELEQTIVD